MGMNGGGFSLYSQCRNIGRLSLSIIRTFIVLLLKERICKWLLLRNEMWKKTVKLLGG